MPRIVITGAPGAGKTALLMALEARGHGIAGDSARAIIRERRRRGLPPRPDAHAFARDVLAMDVGNFARHAVTPGLVFFERGVIDALCMLAQAAPLPEGELHAWLARCAYHPEVFVLPPWRDIYANDAERDQTFEEAVRVDRVTRAWYRRCGYTVLAVPTGSIDARCTFVLDALADAGA